MLRAATDPESLELTTDQSDRRVEQLWVITLMDPAARSGWVRQRDRRGVDGSIRNVVRATNELGQRQVRQEPRYCQAADENQKLGKCAFAQ